LGLICRQSPRGLIFRFAIVKRSSVHRASGSKDFRDDFRSSLLTHIHRQSAHTFLLITAIFLSLGLSAAAAQSPEVTPAVSAALGCRPIQRNDLVYEGAFRLPGGQIGVSNFEYGGTAIAFNSARKSLFMVGHDWHQAVAEISIPTIRTGAMDKLATAKVLQPFIDVKGRVPNNTLIDPNPVKIGGLLVIDNQLVGTLYEYYDGEGNAVHSHFRLDSLDLAKANVSGLFQVGQLGGGFVGGYMTPVPAEWRASLGVSYLTGQAALNIISRTSAGPAAFGFDPAQLGATPAPITPLVYYPLAHPLAPEKTQNPYFNLTTRINGVVFPDGTGSLIFFGSHGIGHYWYGEAVQGSYNDPDQPHKGTHAPPYVYQAWTYDINDLVTVKNGQKKPWEVPPCDVWTFDLPYPQNRKGIGGVAYDAQSRRIYLSQQLADETRPVIHVFKVPAFDRPRSAQLLRQR
jgi:hypothetical protein